MKDKTIPKHIELSPWKTPLGLRANREKDPELEAYYDEDDIAQIKKQKLKRR
jgi:hypothetical protein